MQENQMPDTFTTPTQSETSDSAAPLQLVPLGEALGRTVERLASQVRTAEEIAARDHEMAMSQRSANWDCLIGRIGRRYAECSPKNFKLSEDTDIAAKQRAVLDSLGKLARNFKQHLESGGNLIIYGPPGTGKDHLLVALLKHAVGNGCDVDWCNGQDLFGAFRDQIDSNGTETDLVRRYVKPQILAISDPVQPKGETSAYATSMLYRIIDGRYRNQKPTWFTVNVATSKEAAEAISGPVFDRMRDNAVTVFCNWPSYRQTNKPEWLK